MPGRAAWPAVQRVVFPFAGDEAALSLYARCRPDAISWSRTSATIAAGERVSFASYLGAFPAGYWRDSARVDAVELTMHVDGAATVSVFTCDEAGPPVSVAAALAGGAFSVTVELDAAVSWVWFEIAAARDAATVRDAEWRLPGGDPGTAAVCVTTHDRRDDCLGVLERLLADPGVADVVGQVIVVDQGRERLRQAAGFDHAADRYGDRLRVIEQANLGGSGGFSRGMIEALQGDADHILLLDDDVVLEPESLRRMLAFAARARGDVVVGAQMLSLQDRTLLHSFGERVERAGFWWTPVDAALAPVDLASTAIEDEPALRRVYDVDFNGWWMCLIPTALVRRVGAAMPFFIKWDDAEFGLRAAAAGVRTVTLPGACIWHMPWTGKDDGLDWQAYYQLRNRLVTALIHSTSRRGAGVLAATLAQDANHVLCMQYGSAAARRAAVQDVLAGPGHLPATLSVRTADMRALLRRAGQVVVSDTELPPASSRRGAQRPAGLPAVLWRAVRVFGHQAARPHEAAATVQRALPRSSGKWWALGLLDSATVESATGTGAFVLRRNRGVSASLLRDALLLRVRLWTRWPRLARQYRDAVPALTSPESWNRLFEQAGGVDTPAAPSQTPAS